ncbi:hypothetical protein LWE61_18785 [Sphingobium sufflavum]|uniref:hypothetical protein n=1 Tax=Sphingobium sufflavum TaxID=1129547 RepID=UPI001F2849AA|nr:hypothetical protein [Sphingobium sufflavum]MCE7798581.1 hypothetical protein [Sphingobium sufflavum]
MSHEVDRLYYQRCAEKEREKAGKVADVTIRQTHERLAEMYEGKALRMQGHIAGRDGQ